MKRIFLSILMLLAFTGASLAEQTLLTGRVVHGGYGGPVAKFTNFNGEFGVLAGGEGGWILNHTFMIGGGGYGLATDHQASSVPADFPWALDETRMEFGYGGVILSYIGHSDQVLHPTFSMLIGGGAVNVGRDYEHDWLESQDTGDQRYADRFFVFEPSASAELNLVSFMRLDVGAGYLLISGVNHWGLTNSDVSGVTGSATLKFGKF